MFRSGKEDFSQKSVLAKIIRSAVLKMCILRFHGAGFVCGVHGFDANSQVHSQPGS